MWNLFARPEWLWLLTALLPLSIWIAWGRRRRARAWSRLGQGGHPLGDGAWSWLGAMACLLVALAQPRWGRAAAPPLPPGQDVVLLVDTSLSMGSEDAIPNRLGVAVEAAESLVAALGKVLGNRVGVVAFSGRGVVRCPLTENLGAVIDSLRELRPGDVLPRGTDLNAALDAANEAFDGEEHSEGRSIVVFSDGEDLTGTWKTALDRLKRSGVVVHTVAIGDPEVGHPVPSGPFGQPLMYGGKPVSSRRSDAAMAALARATGGAMVPLGLASADLGSLYERRIAPIARRRHDALRLGDRIERYPAFVVGGLLLGVAGSWPRRRRWQLRGERALTLLAVAILAMGAGPAGETAREAVAAGQRAYQSGEFAAALAVFERAILLDPQAPVPRYDAAAALYQLGRHGDAMARYLEARARAGPALRTKIDYALGNSALASGDITAALRHYDLCLASRVAGPVYDAVRRDAAINRRFAEEQAKRSAQQAEETPPHGRPEAKATPKPPESDRGPPSEREPTPAPAGGQDAERSPFRGPGGAGGTGSAPPQVGTPEQRLANALQNVREARRRRLPDTPPPPSTEVDSKEW